MKRLYMICRVRGISTRPTMQVHSLECSRAVLYEM
jgi:hypothetical protein